MIRDLLKKHRIAYGKSGNLYEHKGIKSLYAKSTILPAYIGALGFKVTVNTAINFTEYAYGSSKLYSKPRDLAVETSSMCNHTCSQCIRYTEEYDNSNDGLMSYDDFIKIYAQFPIIEKLILFGVGEPAMNKDLFKMINHAKARKHPPIVTINSNGLILSGKIFERFMESKEKPDELTISLDACTSETYRKVKITELDFNEITSNIRKVTGACSNDIEVYLSFVIMDQNYEEMPDFMRLAKKLGVQGVTFIELYSTWIYEKNKHVKVRDVEKFKPVVAETKKLADELGINMTYKYVNSEVWGEEKCYNPCRFPWTYVYVTWDGFVQPCCFRTSHKEYNLGNLLKDDFRTLWNSVEYRNFRNIIKSGMLHNVCGDCFAKWD